MEDHMDVDAGPLVLGDTDSEPEPPLVLGDTDSDEDDEDDMIVGLMAFGAMASRKSVSAAAGGLRQARKSAPAVITDDDINDDDENEEELVVTDWKKQVLPSRQGPSAATRRKQPLTSSKRKRKSPSMEGVETNAESGVNTFNFKKLIHVRVSSLDLSSRVPLRDPSHLPSELFFQITVALTSCNPPHPTNIKTLLSRSEVVPFYPASSSTFRTDALYPPLSLSLEPSVSSRPHEKDLRLDISVKPPEGFGRELLARYDYALDGVVVHEGGSHAKNGRGDNKDAIEAWCTPPALKPLVKRDPSLPPRTPVPLRRRPRPATSTPSPSFVATPSYSHVNWVPRAIPLEDNLLEAYPALEHWETLATSFTTKEGPPKVQVSWEEMMDDLGKSFVAGHEDVEDPVERRRLEQASLDDYVDSIVMDDSCTPALIRHHFKALRTLLGSSNFSLDFLTATGWPVPLEVLAVEDDLNDILFAFQERVSWPVPELLFQHAMISGEPLFEWQQPKTVPVAKTRVVQCTFCGAYNCQTVEWSKEDVADLKEICGESPSHTTCNLAIELEKPCYEVGIQVGRLRLALSLAPDPPSTELPRAIGVPTSKFKAGELVSLQNSYGFEPCSHPGRPGTRCTHYCVCGNNHMGTSRRRATAVFHSKFPDAGFGLVLLEDAKKDDLISIYAGEWLDSSSNHMAVHDVCGPTVSYQFNLDEQSMVDSVYSGNHSRFLNHGKTSKNEAAGIDRNAANCVPREIFVQGTHQMGLYAMRDMKSGTELLFDYGKQYGSWWTEQRAGGGG
ncbi:hypothetical protein RQP46_000155 [Phenoliferia psychrophenolica]